MKKNVLSIILLVCTLTVVAQQQLSVKQMLATNDLSASQNRRVDSSGELCALVKVQLAATNASFEGDIVGTVDVKSGEYWIYMSPGARGLSISCPGFKPLYVSFSDYNIANGVASLTTYNMTLLMPQTAAKDDGQRYLIMKLTPTNSTVYIDGKQQNAIDGILTVTLPAGNHRYRVTAKDYYPKTGVIHLSDSRTTFPVTLSEKEGVDIEAVTVNDVVFNMVGVAGGSFMMGATSEQVIDDDPEEVPVHRVTLSDYYISQTEITQGQWKAVMGALPLHIGNNMGDNYPVVGVTWDDCQDYVKKLSALTGQEFRLPTEAQWEFAARGGTLSKGYRYSGDNDATKVGWIVDNTGKALETADMAYTETTERMHAVGQLKANELGIYDFCGNVREWCYDLEGEYTSESQTNPTGPAASSNSSNSDESHIVRGGYYGAKAEYARNAYRMDYSRNSYDQMTGFRIVLVRQVPKPPKVADFNTEIRGKTTSQLNALAKDYLNGENDKPKNLERAYKLYRLSAERRDAEGQERIGNMYLNGIYVKKSWEEAAKWYEKAAKQDNINALFVMGVFYQYGQAGLKKDIKKAKKMYTKAANQGDEASISALKNIE